MTRGQLILLLGDNQFMNSIEFNGDMYPAYVDDDGHRWDGHGNDAFAMLSKVTNVDEYQKVVTTFDDKYFGYAKLDHEPQMIFKGHGKEYFDLTKNYFDNWFSDYLYIKNISNEDITFIAYDKGDSQKKVTAIIPAGGIGVFNFNHVADDIDSDIIISNFEKIDNDSLYKQITNYMVNIMTKWQNISPITAVNKVNFGNLFILDDLRFRLENVTITNEEFPKIVTIIKDNQFPQMIIDFSNDCNEYPIINEDYCVDNFLQDLENWI